jgi:hypothetical protein
MSNQISSPTITSAPNPFIRADIGSLSSYLLSNLSNTPTLTQAAIQSALQNYISQNGNQPIPQGQMLPDFESNKGELINLLASYPAWADIITAGIGETLAEMFATIATYNQMAIERGVQETQLGTSILSSSIYEIANSNGVRIQRCQPAYMTANISIPNPIADVFTIPPYTQFNSNGVNYFNRAAITIPQGSTTAFNVTLYQGTVGVINFTATGGIFQVYEFGNSDFSISDSDVLVSVNGVPFENTQFNSYLYAGLWEYGPSANVFIQNTNSAGNVEISFGDGNYGVSPNANSQIQVTFVTTLGAAGNSNSTNATVSCASLNQVSGISTSVTQNGANQKSALEYKFLGPALYYANYRAVTINDYKAVALLYPGVIDALFLGQSQFAPTNLEYMMNVQAYILTNEVWTTAQTTAFLGYMQNLGAANIVILPQTLTTITVDITASVYCFPQSDLTSVQNLVYGNIYSAFSLTVGSINYPYYLSDIIKQIESASSDIDYVILNTPTASILPLSTSSGSVVQLGSVSLSMNFSTRNTLG